MCVLVKRVSIFVAEEFPTLHRPYFFLVPAFFPAPKTLLTFLFTSLHPTFRNFAVALELFGLNYYFITLYFHK